MSDLGDEDYTPFERELLFAVFDAATPAAEIFRSQIARSKVLGREYTGSGSYTNIEVERSAPTALGVCSTPAEQRSVAIWRPDFTTAAGCVVFVNRDGYISCLEIYTYGDAWDDDPAKWIIVSDSSDMSRNPFATPH